MEQKFTFNHSRQTLRGPRGCSMTHVLLTLNTHPCQEGGKKALKTKWKKREWLRNKGQQSVLRHVLFILPLKNMEKKKQKKTPPGAPALIWQSFDMRWIHGLDFHSFLYSWRWHCVAIVLTSSVALFNVNPFLCPTRQATFSPSSLAPRAEGTNPAHLRNRIGRREKKKNEEKGTSAHIEQRLRT